jgi:hypothetical protein
MPDEILAMTTHHIIGEAVSLLLTALLIIIPLSALARLASAAFSLQVRQAIRQHPVAHSIWCIAGLLAAFLLVFCYAAGRAESRARFVNLMNELKQADYEYRQRGGLTNQPRNFRISSFTNVYSVGGTNYSCEFLIECEELRERGSLAITTNGIFVWIDQKRGVLPLLRQNSQVAFPPGI